MHTPTEFQDNLRNLFFIGGSPCSGKSTIADALVDRYQMILYRCDDAFYRHLKVLSPEKQPVFSRVMNLSPEVLWMRPVDQQTAEEIEIYREEFDMILADLHSLSRDRPVLVEGAAMLPELVAPLIDSPNQAIWVVPTPEFQWTHYRARDWWREVLKDCSDLEQAFQNWMARDAAFAKFVTDEACARGLRVITVDGQAALCENLAAVEAHFQIERLNNPLG